MAIGHIVAVAVGIGIAVQVAILGRSAPATHPLAVSLGLQIAGVIVAAAWATRSGAWTEPISVGRNWWWIPLGAAGWMVVAALGFASSRIGVATTLAVSVAAQLVAAFVLDATAGSGLPDRRAVLGAALLITGAVILGSAS